MKKGGIFVPSVVVSREVAHQILQGMVPAVVI